MKSCFVRTNGIRLHYLDSQTQGPAMVMLPGLTANAHSFDGLVAAGLATRMRVLALDLRGRGESDQPETYTLADHAADVIGFLDRLGLDRVVLVGHSFGGLVTYQLAVTQPERITRCVVIDSPVVIRPEVFDQIKPSLDRLDAVFPSWGDYLRFVKRMPYFGEWWDPTIESYFRADVRENADGSVKPRSRPEHIRAVIDGFKDLGWVETVRRITQPVLFLRAPGAYGPAGSPPVVSTEQAQATLENLPDGRLVEVPGNHMTMLYGTGAQVIVGAITQFVFDASGSDAARPRGRVPSGVASQK
jgi:pimeloyl-ACP methyl ester carboxylesterase